MRKIALFFVLTLLALAACSRQPALVILHTNDTHSHYEPLRTGEEAGFGGAIERAAFVDSVRAACGEDKVLLVHAGDFSQGTSYYTELKGQFEPKILNALKYDCVTLGNHEFDNGIEDLTQRLSMLKGTKVVSSNLDLSQFELSEYVKPYAVIDRGGKKIGLIGLAPSLSRNVSASISSRIPQLDNTEVVNKWASYLKKDLGCDLVLLLSHIGFEEDQVLTPKISNVDIIIGGHSHTFVDEIHYVSDAAGKKVTIVTDGCWGLAMGQLTLR